MSHEVNFSGITPNLVYDDVEVALEWLEHTLGFKERARYVDKGDVIRQAEIYVGKDEVWLSKHTGGYQGPPQYLVVWVDDIDAQYERIKIAGGQASSPTNQSWGVRNFYITDPGGYHWGFHKRLERGYQQVKSPEEGGLREVLKRAGPD